MNNSSAKIGSLSLVKTKAFLTRKETIVDGISLIFVFLFIYTGTSKLIEHDKFQLLLSNSAIITAFSSTLTWMIPPLEIIISILLLINRTKLLGLYSAFGLLVLYTSYIYAVLNFSDEVVYNYGGVLKNLGWSENMLFNGVLMALAIIGIMVKDNILQKQNQQDQYTFI